MSHVEYFYEFDCNIQEKSRRGKENLVNRGFEGMNPEFFHIRRGLPRLIWKKYLPGNRVSIAVNDQGSGLISFEDKLAGDLKGLSLGVLAFDHEIDEAALGLVNRFWKRQYRSYQR
jgi:hypothetical protein